MQRMLKVKDIQEILGCGKNTAYKLVNQTGFPKMRIGKIIYVPEDEFEKWVHSYLKSKFYIG